MPNNSYDRYNFTFRNTTSFLNDKMRLDVGASYILQEDCNMINQGTYNNPLTEPTSSRAAMTGRISKCMSATIP